jgi:Bax protein
VTAFAAVYPFLFEYQVRKPEGSSQSTSSPLQVPSQAVESSQQARATEEKAQLSKPISHKYLPDFSSIRDVKEKKKKFFGYLKPIVAEVNQTVKQERAFIQNLTQFPENSIQIERLTAIAKKYRVELDLEFDDLKHELLLKVDEIPVELVLMQAANESGWGTSRFALQANNLFGQWCFKKGCGVVPEGRPEGQTYEVRKFAKPADSVRSYFANLNSGYAYSELRLLRKQLRDIEEGLDPYVIAEGLIPYSTRREAYVDEIQNMLRVNQKYI